MKRHLNFYDKKGDIGTTMTWVPAFVIIFFLVTLFILGVVILAGTKKITFQDNEIKIENYLQGEQSELNYPIRDLKLANDINSFLLVPLKKDTDLILIEDLLRNIGKGDNDNYKLLEDNAVSFYDGIYDECYSICIDFSYNSEAQETKQILGSACKEEFYSCGELRINKYSSLLYSDAKIKSKDDYFFVKLYKKEIGENNAK